MLLISCVLLLRYIWRIYNYSYHRHGRMEWSIPSTARWVRIVMIDWILCCFLWYNKFCSIQVYGFVPPTINHQNKQEQNCLLPFRKKNVFEKNSFPLTQSTYGRSSSSNSQQYSFQLFGIKGLRAWFDSQFPEAVASIDTTAQQQQSKSSSSTTSRRKKSKQKKSKSSSSAVTTAQDTFDHVLVDMNQILHVTLRRSRGDDSLAVRLVMSELDKVLSVVTPRRSLVLAIDGPPAAAKLATQRRRRFSTLVRTEWKLQHFDKLRLTKRDRARRLRAYQAELESLQITPSTQFMNNMESTLLYWTWQRLQQRNSKFNRVRFYISPSQVAGEGEVKLLEWVLQSANHIKGDTIAILGRDSDLLLEGLILPPYYTTHNIFVIRQETSRLYLVVSLWETTRALYHWLPKSAPPNQILQLRTDVVLLLMMMGNDYLPKLKGAHGFSKICSIYRKLLAEYCDNLDNKGIKKNDHSACIGLVDPSSLEFNLDFAIRFFQAIADLTPSDVWENNNSNQENNAETRRTPLGELNNIMDGGFVPKPLRFQVVDLNTREEEDFVEDENDGDENETVKVQDLDDETVGQDDDEEESDKEELVRLTLGKPGSDECLRYEYWKDPSEPFKSAKQKLASMALDDFLGTDYAEGRDEFDEEMGITTSGYAWEVLHAVEGKVETYLAGLLWNLQTYQDGICADYNYNYGRRKSPNAIDIVEFLQKAEKENRTVGRRDLLGDAFSRPVSGGLSCLAALPSQVKHLVPEPYRSLPEDTVERCYASCMDPEDNCFDLKKFEQLIENEIRGSRGKDAGDNRVTVGNGEDAKGESHHSDQRHGRRIILGDHYWTVIGKAVDRLAHPFQPPSPPLESFAELRWNDRIRASRLFALETPNSRAVWGYPSFGKEKTRQHPHHRSFLDAADEIQHTNLGGLLEGGKKSILDIQYETRFQKNRKKSQRQIPKKKETQNKVSDEDAQIVFSPDGQTAFACLKQLEDIGLIGEIEYSVTPISGGRDVGELHPEETRLVVNIGGASSIIKSELSYELRRDANTQPRQAFKHHLASLALGDILRSSDRKWSDMTFPELRGFLKEKVKTDDS